MGTDKASLPLGNEVMLERMVRIVLDVCQPVVVVAAKEQSLPELPNDVRIVRDSQPDRGPLQALRDGLHALPEKIDAAFVTGCDTPLLLPALITFIAEKIGPHEIALPVNDGFRDPLAAVYRTSCRTKAEELLSSGKRSLTSLLDACDTLEISSDLLKSVDPQLRSLLNCNRPEDYQAVLRLIEKES